MKTCLVDMCNTQTPPPDVAVCLRHQLACESAAIFDPKTQDGPELELHYKTRRGDICHPAGKCKF